MQDVNTRGTFVVSKHCVPHLRRAENPHVLTLSPPLSLDPKWAATHLGYTLAKFGMSFCTLGIAEEGVTDLSRYFSGGAESELQADLFVEE